MAYQPSVSEEAVQKATGKSWSQWFKVLDNWGATKKSHKEIARHLSDTEDISGWWAQSITVEYERARGMRDVGQVASKKFELSVQRTLPTDLDTLKSLWLEGRRRSGWISDASWRDAFTKAMRTRNETVTAMGDCVYLKLPVGANERADRVQLTFSAKDKERAVVRVQHGGIASAKERDVLKADWKNMLDALQTKVVPA